MAAAASTRSRSRSPTLESKRTKVATKLCDTMTKLFEATDSDEDAAEAQLNAKEGLWSVCDAMLRQERVLEFCASVQRAVQKATQAPKTAFVVDIVGGECAYDDKGKVLVRAQKKKKKGTAKPDALDKALLLLRDHFTCAGIQACFTTFVIAPPDRVLSATPEPVSLPAKWALPTGWTLDRTTAHQPRLAECNEDDIAESVKEWERDPVTGNHRANFSLYSSSVVFVVPK